MENLGFTTEELAKLGGELGADVAFFMYRQTCICRGKGELVEPIELALNDELLLIKPQFGVSTPIAYKAWKDSAEVAGISYQAQSMPWGKMVNDLERPVFEKHRFLAELKMWLLKRPEVKGAMMSGSGSTIFAIVRGETEMLQTCLKEEVDSTLWLMNTRF